MNESLLTSEILTPQLYTGVRELTQKDQTVNEDILILNYLTFAGFWNNNRCNIQVGDISPIRTNIYALIVANSGYGKSRTNRLFFSPAFEIQNQLFNEHEKDKQFVSSCLSLTNDGIIDTIPKENQERFIQAYNQKNGTDYETLNLKTPKEHIFLALDFSPEKLTKTFNHSRNHTILINSDEFEHLKQNFGRTNTVENVYTELTTYFEGRDNLIIRIGKDTDSVKGGYLSLISNTTPDTFNALKNSNFFNSGCGYRYLIYKQISTNINPPMKTNRLAEGSEKTPYEQFQEKIATIFKEYFYEQIYNSDAEPVIFTINEPENLEYYDECIHKLWNDHVTDNENLTDQQKETVKNRLKTMLNKLILNVFIMNYSFSNYKNWKPFENNTELTKDDIKRGYLAYDYFLGNMMQIFTTEKENDLTPKQTAVIELIPENSEMSFPELKDLAVNKKKLISKSGFHELMNKKSIRFNVYDNYLTREKIVKRIM